MRDHTPRRRIPILGSFGRIARLTWIEIGKLFSHKFLPAVLLITLFVTTGLGLAGKYFSDTPTATAKFSNYTLWVAASTFGLQIGIILLVALGAMAMSSEATARTLNTMLTRPIRRIEFGLAKALSMVFATVLVVAAAGLAGFVVGGTMRDRAAAGAFTFGKGGAATEAARPWWKPSYGDIRDPLYPEDTIIATKGEVMGSMLFGFALLVVPIMAAVSIGFLFGTVLDSAGLAIGLSVGFFMTLETTKFSGFFEGVLGPYLYNYPLNRISTLMGNAGVGIHPVWTDALTGVATSAIYVAACFLISFAIFCRRDVTL